MKIFEARNVTNEEIVLKNVNKLKDLYDAIQNSEDFILVWRDGAVAKSMVVVAGNMTSRVSSGEIQLKAQQPASSIPAVPSTDDDDDEDEEGEEDDQD